MASPRASTVRPGPAVGSAVVAAVAVLAGCSYSPNHYTTPRTLDPGTFQGGIAIDAIAAADPNVRHIPTSTLHGRVGIVRRVDLGLTLNLPFSASLSAKTLIYTSRLVDIASFARFNVTWWWVPRIDYARLLHPVFRCPTEERYCVGEWLALGDLTALVGFNLARDVTLVVSPGVFLRATDPYRLGYRAGVGVQWRVTDDIAIYPELTYMPDISPLNSRAVFYGIAVQGRGHDGYAKTRAAAKRPPDPVR